MTLDESIEYLKASPIFAMSLSSKELFHSNFWAWLIEQDGEYAKIFFGNVSTDSIKVEREQGNRDVTIWVNDKAYVIENKFKSIPNISQLERYTEKLKNKFDSGVLTGVIEPQFELPNKWSFISYKEIAEKIIDITSQSKQTIIKQNENLIRNYVELLECLMNLLDNAIGCDPILTYKYNDIFKQIRFSDIYQKISASKFISWFNEKYKSKIKELDKVDGYNLCIRTDFSKGNVIIDLRYNIENYDKTDCDDKYSCFGIQIQGKQFRLCAEQNIKNYQTTLYDECIKNNWFDIEFDKDKNKLIFNKKTSMKKNYNSFCTAKYTFVYQYYDLNFKNGISYDELAEQIINYLEKAQSILIEKKW